MSRATQNLRTSASQVRKASAALEAAARRAQKPRRSIPGKVAFAITSTRLALQAARMGVMVLKRYPVAGTLVLAGVAIALCSPRVRERLARQEW